MIINEMWLRWHDGARDRDMVRLELATTVLKIPEHARLAPNHEVDALRKEHAAWIAYGKNMACSRPVGLDFVVPHRDAFATMAS